MTPPLIIIQVLGKPVVFKIERDISLALRNWNHMLTQSVSNTSFIEHVWVLVSQIAYHNERLEYERKHVLNHRRVVPNVINSLTFETC